MVDNYERSLTIYNQIIHASSIFNDLFSTICPIKSIEVNVNHDISLSKNISPIQYDNLVRLSGHLTNAIDDLRLLKKDILYFNSDTSNDLDQVSKLEQLIENKERLLNINSSKVLALQEYLVSELKYSSKLEDDYKILEDKLKKCERQRNLYASKLKITVQSSNPSIKNNNENKLIGVFISKPFGKQYFFGVTVDFVEPYFKVIYSDGDSEELTKAEVTKFNVEFIPRLYKQSCFKEAKKNGYNLNISTNDYSSESDDIYLQEDETNENDLNHIDNSKDIVNDEDSFQFVDNVVSSRESSNNDIYIIKNVDECDFTSVDENTSSLTKLSPNYTNNRNVSSVKKRPLAAHQEDVLKEIVSSPKKNLEIISSPKKGLELKSNPKNDSNKKARKGPINRLAQIPLVGNKENPIMLLDSSSESNSTIKSDNSSSISTSELSDMEFNITSRLNKHR